MRKTPLKHLSSYKVLSFKVHAVRDILAKHVAYAFSLLDKARDKVGEKLPSWRGKR